jgi:flagellin
MVVQHNMQAMNSNRMLGVTTNAQAKSTEKLSSGFKINRAADDAAGLSISEKMRKQINGLDRASTNAQDGVSAVQTAEGALTEVHSMLQRMNELAVQAANGTNSTSDRQSIQNEIDQLTTEIDRVAETTKFNETYLLKGDVDGNTKTETLNGHDAGLKGKFAEVKDANGNGTGVYKLTIKEVAAGDTVNIGGKNYEIIADSATNDYAGGKLKAASAYTLMKNELMAANAVGTGADVTRNTSSGAVTLGTAISGATAAQVSDAAAGGTGEKVFTITAAKVTTEKALSFNLHVGADADMTNKIGVDINTMNSTFLGVKGLDVVGENNDNGITATYAIDAIADAVQKVSDQRSALGAIQNRLEHTIANVDNVVENTTAAESRIRDTDMAEEMVTYSKNNILAQAGQSMLAQANQSTQGVLSLLG